MAEILTPPLICPFCDQIENGFRVMISADPAVMFEDAYPVSPGHVLVVSRRHATRLGELTSQEVLGLWNLVAVACDWIEQSHAPDGYNIGINDGAAAGQTVPHVHVHVIPRYAGDSHDPRGGVRWVMPDRAAYWRRADD